MITFFVLVFVLGLSIGVAVITAKPDFSLARNLILASATFVAVYMAIIIVGLEF